MENNINKINERIYILKSQIQNDQTHTKNGKPLKWYLKALKELKELDKQFEKEGYKYLYECSDEEVKEVCNANDYYFTIEGDSIG